MSRLAGGQVCGWPVGVQADGQVNESMVGWKNQNMRKCTLNVTLTIEFAVKSHRRLKVEIFGLKDAVTPLERCVARR